MLAKTDWVQLIPHAGTMCLLDAVLAWGERSIHAISASHARADNPLRGPQGLHAVHLAEYGAQAMAVHGGLRARAAGGAAKPGLLVALRGVQLHVARIDDLPGPLECEAEVLVEAESSQQYGFRIHHAGLLLAEGRAAVMLQAAIP